MQTVKPIRIGSTVACSQYYQETHKKKNNQKQKEHDQQLNRITTGPNMSYKPHENHKPKAWRIKLLFLSNVKGLLILIL